MQKFSLTRLITVLFNVVPCTSRMVAVQFRITFAQYSHYLSLPEMLLLLRIKLYKFLYDCHCAVYQLTLLNATVLHNYYFFVYCIQSSCLGECCFNNLLCISKLLDGYVSQYTFQLMLPPQQTLFCGFIFEYTYTSTAKWYVTQY